MLDRLRRSSVLATLMLLAASVALPAQKPAVADVLKSAGDYLLDYAQRLSAVGAEEEYTQFDTRVASATRRFLSDFVLVGWPDGTIAGYRDVYSIDANRVRERDDRLLKMFQQRALPGLHEEASAISNAALRFYVNANLRGLDMPTLPLEYLRQANQSKCVFTLDGVKNMDGAQVAILKFKVTDPTGLLPTPDGATTTGKFWIETGTGAVRQTELSISGTAFTFRVAAKYGRQESLGLWAPIELFQQVEISGSIQGMPNLGAVASADGMMSSARQSLEGRSKYSKYRRLKAS